MTNKDVVALLEEIAVLLDLSGESPFKSRAYTNVARQIEQTEEDVVQLAREGRLREIKGVGDALEQKITEYVSAGSLKYHDDLRAKFPETLFQLFDIPGLGAKRIKTLYADLGVESMVDLEKACKESTLTHLKGFGPKMVEKILHGIEFAREHRDQHLLNTALDEARRLKNVLSDHPAAIRVSIAGSLRRHKEVVKDIDIVASSVEPEALMKRFVEDEQVEAVTGHGDTKSSVVLRSGIAADLRVVSDAQYPYALMHFTGSKEHNVAMRQRAKDRDLKLNEYGLFKGKKNIPCVEEADIYAALDLPDIPPELREDTGELDLETTPELVTMDDLIGMIHCHTVYSDGRATVEEMARGAKERGYKYITITDHSQSAAYAGGLTPKRVEKQHAEIDALNGKLKGIKLLKGIEADILTNGALDYKEPVLKKFDLVIASVHSKLQMDEAEATARVVKAVENPYTTILGHMTGRLLLAREGYPLDYDKVFDACAANKVAIEINANCHRLDIDWRLIRRARDRGVKFSIGPDAHSVEGMDDMKYGVGIARKGWLEPADVLNTLPFKAFVKWCA